jgi:hydrogenase maturation protease
VNQRILIACIGNIFMGDDAFGFEVSRALASAQLPSSVTVVDFGIRGLDLAYALLDAWHAVILVDAVHRGGPPGTLYLLKPADAASEEMGIDPHSMDPIRVLATARSLGDVNADIYIVGCEPGDFGDELEGRMGLSPAVALAIPEAVNMVTDQVNRLLGAEIAACIVI